MKKKLLWIISSILLVVFLVSCQNNQEVEKNQADTSESEVLVTEEAKEKEKSLVRIGGMTGATGVGLANLIDQGKNEKLNFKTDFLLVSKPDELVAAIGKGDLDLAVVPANLASILYKKTEKTIKVLAQNNLGVLYVVEVGDTINSIKDLEGKDIISTGKGATPELVINYLFGKENISLENVNVNYVTEAAEAAKALISGQVNLGILPEPMVSTILEKNENARIALNLNDVWREVSPDSKQITSVLIASKDFLDNNGDLVPEILDAYKNSIEEAKNNPEKTGQITEELGILNKGILIKSIDNLNLEFSSGEDFKNDLEKYLSILGEFDPKIIGGEVPDEEFYY